MAPRTIIVWALAAAALVPSVAVGAGEDIERIGTDASVLFGGGAPLAALRVPGAPNPVLLAVDAADAYGLALGETSEGGFTPDGPVPLFEVKWFPYVFEEDGFDAGSFLAGQEVTDEDLDAALLVAGRKTDRFLGEQAEPQFRAVPRGSVAWDALRLRVDAAVAVAPASADGAALALPRGIAGIDPGAAGVAGAAPAQPSAASLALAPGEGLASRAPGGAAPAAAWPAPPLAASIAAAPAPAGDAALAVGAVAAGLLLGGLALYHLVNRNNIFENDVRMQVYDIVARNPGVTIQEVARVVGLSHPTARYHLNVLAKNDLVVFLDKGNKMMFFRNRNEFSEGERELVAILRNPEAMRVYDTIEQSPWILRKELSERLGISRTSVNWHLRNLMRAGLVAETREQGKGFLFVRREGRELLLRVTARVGPATPPVAAVPATVPMPMPAANGNGHQQPA